MKTLLLILIITGCATADGFAQRLNTWKGHNISDVIRSTGKPNQIFNLPDGDIAYEFYLSNGIVRNSNGQMETVQESYCKWTFYTHRHIVQQFSFEGPRCKARPLN